MTDKLTKQGVRDLSHLKGKSVGRRLEAPPVPVACRHKNTRVLDSYGVSFLICEDCDETISEW